MLVYNKQIISLLLTLQLSVDISLATPLADDGRQFAPPQRPNLVGPNSLPPQKDDVKSSGFGGILPPPVRPKLVGPDSLPPFQLEPETGKAEPDSILAKTDRSLKVGAGYLGASEGQNNVSVAGLSFSSADSFSQSCNQKSKLDCSCPPQVSNSTCECKTETTACDTTGAVCTCCTTTSCKVQQYQNLPELGNWPELNLPVLRLPLFPSKPRLPDIKIPRLEVPRLPMPPLPTFPAGLSNMTANSSTKVFQQCDMIASKAQAECICPPPADGKPTEGCTCEAQVKDCQGEACLCCIKESCHKETSSKS